MMDFLSPHNCRRACASSLLRHELSHPVRHTQRYRRCVGGRLYLFKSTFFPFITVLWDLVQRTRELGARCRRAALDADLNNRVRRSADGAEEVLHLLAGLVAADIGLDFRCRAGLVHRRAIGAAALRLRLLERLHLAACLQNVLRESAHVIPWGRIVGADVRAVLGVLRDGDAHVCGPAPHDLRKVPGAARKRRLAEVVPWVGDLVVPHLHRVRNGEVIPARPREVLPHSVVAAVVHLPNLRHVIRPLDGRFVALIIPRERLRAMGLAVVVVRVKAFLDHGLEVVACGCGGCRSVLFGRHRSGRLSLLHLGQAPFAEGKPLTFWVRHDNPNGIRVEHIAARAHDNERRNPADAELTRKSAPGVAILEVKRKPRVVTHIVVVAAFVAVHCAPDNVGAAVQRLVVLRELRGELSARWAELRAEVEHCGAAFKTRHSDGAAVRTAAERRHAG
eukprot:PhM_4_TR2639/c0_g1_i1/m.13565